MQQIFRVLIPAIAIVGAVALAFGAGSPAYAQSCESEETATEECFLDGIAAIESAPAFGVSPGASGSMASPPVAGADSRAVPAQVAPAIVPSPLPRPSVRIWTDRRHYWVGDEIKVCFRIPGPGRVQITDVMPDGSRHVLWARREKGRGDCLSAWITPPTGTECLVLRWDPLWDDGRRYLVPQESSPAAAAIAIAPIMPRSYFAKTCFQTSGDWDYGWDILPYEGDVVAYR
jgi:hypothetical protein